MKSAILAGIVAVLLLCCAVAPSAHAQGVGASGSIRGTVTDATGAVVPHAAVEVLDVDRGQTYDTFTDASGQYQFNSLQPATYSVTAHNTGFQTETQTGLSLNIGQVAVVDFHLKVATSATQVTVTAEPPVVETERGSQADTVTQRYIEDLPISRRDYLTFTLLLPGVSNSNIIASNADYRVQQTPQSGLSFYGSNGRGNNITVDGGEFNDDAGGVRPNLSQDAIQEFQVNRSNYGADLGSGSGASINIVSKSGTNNVHGSLFGFFRNDALDARDHFAFAPALTPTDTFSLDSQGAPIKNSLNRQQFGGSVGFPIKKDKTFLFIAYEGLRSDAQDAVTLFTNSNILASSPAQNGVIGGLAGLGNTPVPCISNPADPTNFASATVLPAIQCAGFLQNCLNITPSPSLCQTNGATQALNPFIINQFETNGGLFPFPIRSNEGSVRLDHRIDEANQLAFRYSYSHLNEDDPNVQALTAFSRGTRVTAWDSTAQGSWFHNFNPTTQNELRLQWSWSYLNVGTNDQGGPGLDFQGFGYFGRGIFLPSKTTSRRYEVADNVTLARGRHTIKLGAYELVRGNNTTSQTFFAGRFEFLTLPSFLVSPCLYAPIACGLPTTGSAQISSLQAGSLGLPAFYEQGFGNPNYSLNRPLTAFYAQDAWQVTPNLTFNYGLRYDIDKQSQLLGTNYHNFAPRISFAWDPFKDHKTVVRGGFGIFYSPIYAQIDNVVKTLGDVNGTRQIANTLVTLNGVNDNGTPIPQLNSAFLFQSLFGEGKVQCGTPPPGQTTCVSQTDLANLGVNVSNTGPLPPGSVLFFGQKGFSNPYSEQASLGIEREVGPGFTVSVSYVYVHTLRLPVSIDTNLLNGAPITTSAANGLPTNGLPFQNWGVGPCVNAFNQPSGTTCFANPFLLQNNEYASIGAAVYQGGIIEMRKRFGNHVTMLANYTYSKAVDNVTDFNSDYAPFNEIDLAAEHALSDFDQRHKVVIAGVFDSPWEHNKFLQGFQLSPVFNYNSGHPFNLLAGSDINGDNHFTNDRPPGSPRNSGLGPNYIDFDLRLSRAFRITEKYQLVFTAESFNLANRTNYTAVNNIVGPDFGPPFNVRGSAQISPSDPLGFTAATPKREIQLGARFIF
jgi:Carboxypeptidase regulatory-like domain/TonB dependent receptor